MIEYKWTNEETVKMTKHIIYETESTLKIQSEYKSAIWNHDPRLIMLWYENTGVKIYKIKVR